MIKSKLFVFFVCLLIGQTITAQVITSISDEKIPDELREKIFQFRFTDSNNTLSGSYRNVIEGRGITYEYSFTMYDNELTGEIKIRIVNPHAYAYAGLKKYQVRLPKILKCCKMPDISEETCFRPDDDEGIKAATNNGCKDWYKKVIH